MDPAGGEIGEPHSAGAVEHDVVGGDERARCGVVVQRGDLTGFEVDALDRTRPPAGTEPAVVADVHRGVGTDGEAVRATTHLGDRRDRPIGTAPGHPTGADLADEHRSVGHRHGPLGERQPFGDDLDIDEPSALDLRTRSHSLFLPSRFESYEPSRRSPDAARDTGGIVK